MSLVKPFRGLRPVAGRSEDVVAPPYDVVDRAEAKGTGHGRPWSFLHISRPEIDLPDDVDPYDPAVYAKGRENLDRMVAEGVLVRDARALLLRLPADHGRMCRPGWWRRPRSGLRPTQNQNTNSRVR